jgi:hypothetical protein
MQLATRLFLVTTSSLFRRPRHDIKPPTGCIHFDDFFGDVCFVVEPMTDDGNSRE